MKNLFKGLLLDEVSVERIYKDVCKNENVLHLNNFRHYHSIWKRPFLAIGVLFGKCMCVHFEDKHNPKGE